MDAFMFAAGILGIRIAAINVQPLAVGRFMRTADIMDVDITDTTIVCHWERAA